MRGKITPRARTLPTDWHITVTAKSGRAIHLSEMLKTVMRVRKADFLTWLENRGISPYIPLRLHYPSGNQLYGLDRFTYRPETNSFECPEGKELKYRGIKAAANRSHV